MLLDAARREHIHNVWGSERNLLRSVDAHGSNLRCVDRFRVEGLCRALRYRFPGSHVGEFTNRSPEKPGGRQRRREPDDHGVGARADLRGRQHRRQLRDGVCRPELLAGRHLGPPLCLVAGLPDRGSRLVRRALHPRHHPWPRRTCARPPGHLRGGGGRAGPAGGCAAPAGEERGVPGSAAGLPGRDRDGKLRAARRRDAARLRRLQGPRQPQRQRRSGGRGLAGGGTALGRGVGARRTGTPGPGPQPRVGVPGHGRHDRLRGASDLHVDPVARVHRARRHHRGGGRADCSGVGVGGNGRAGGGRGVCGHAGQGHPDADGQPACSAGVGGAGLGAVDHERGPEVRVGEAGRADAPQPARARRQRILPLRRQPGAPQGPRARVQHGRQDLPRPHLRAHHPVAPLLPPSEPLLPVLLPLVGPARRRVGAHRRRGRHPPSSLGDSEPSPATQAARAARERRERRDGADAAGSGQRRVCERAAAARHSRQHRR
mmetsp:Transcript_7596/g.15240  ORF Transcript_7596/g.15240 Transcript_7596/m.15240 type:complete len:489 (-) Transcript_7596:490-1956(-)